MSTRSTRNQNGKRLVKLSRQSDRAVREEAALKRFKSLMKKNEGRLSFAVCGEKAASIQSSEPQRMK